MRIRRTPRAPLGLELREPDPGPWALLAGLFGLLALGVAHRFPAVVDMLPRCPFLTLTGLPCPTCGISRALVGFARGDLAGAFSYHPLAVLGTAGAIAFGLWACGSLLAPSRFRLPRLEGRRQVVLARGLAIALLVNWAYLLTNPLLARFPQ